jgi:hypothetical protein
MEGLYRNGRVEIAVARATAGRPICRAEWRIIPLLGFNDENKVYKYSI